jgi:hypothetical protein
VRFCCEPGRRTPWAPGADRCTLRLGFFFAATHHQNEKPRPAKLTGAKSCGLRSTDARLSGLIRSGVVNKKGAPHRPCEKERLQ